MLRYEAQDARCRALVALWQRHGSERALHLLWDELRAYLGRCEGRMARRGMGICRGDGDGPLYLLLASAAGKFDLSSPPARLFRVFAALEHRTACTNRYKIDGGRSRIMAAWRSERQGRAGEACRTTGDRLSHMTNVGGLLDAKSAKNGL